MKYRFHYVFLILLTTTLSCQECDDCNSFVGEPTVEIVLVNGDSLSTVNSQISADQFIFDSLSNEADTLNDELLVWRDSLEIINDSIANGGDLDDLAQEIQDQITADSIQLITLSDSIDQKDVALQSLDSIAQLISSGLVLLDTIMNRTNGNHLLPDDSVESFSVALDYTNPITALRFSLYQQAYDLDLSHQNTEKVNLDGEWIISITDITIDSYTFDTVFASCNNCIPSETTITCYY